MAAAILWGLFLMFVFAVGLAVIIGAFIYTIKSMLGFGPDDSDNKGDRK